MGQKERLLKVKLSVQVVEAVCFWWRGNPRVDSNHEVFTSTEFVSHQDLSTDLFADGACDPMFPESEILMSG